VIAPATETPRGERSHAVGAHVAERHRRPAIGSWRPVWLFFAWSKDFGNGKAQRDGRGCVTGFRDVRPIAGGAGARPDHPISGRQDYHSRDGRCQNTCTHKSRLASNGWSQFGENNACLLCSERHMQKELIRETQAQAQFPKWVIRAVSAMSAPRPLYPRNRTFVCWVGTAEMCHQYQTPLLRRPVARDRDHRKGRYPHDTIAKNVYAHSGGLSVSQGSNQVQSLRMIF
jgi:hypothetical protein